MSRNSEPRTGGVGIDEVPPAAKSSLGTGARVVMTARKPNPIDVHVGSRVRLRRMFVGMSQERLGEQMELTFQQIQKYEKGTNRIGASRLFQLSEILSVPVGFFFEGMEMPNMNLGSRSPGFAEPASESYVMDFLDSREGVELNRAFVKITDPKVRKSIVDMVRAMAEADKNNR
jgi:transcriptional regulator with XRE-family HTH domain